MFFSVTPEDKVIQKAQMTLQHNVRLHGPNNKHTPCPNYTCVALSLSFLDSLWCSLSFFFFKKPKTLWPFFFSCLSSMLPSPTGRPDADRRTAWKTQQDCLGKNQSVLTCEAHYQTLLRQTPWREILLQAKWGNIHAVLFPSLVGNQQGFFQALDRKTT